MPVQVTGLLLKLFKVARFARIARSVEPMRSRAVAGANANEHDSFFPMDNNGLLAAGLWTLLLYKCCTLSAQYEEEQQMYDVIETMTERRDLAHTLIEEARERMNATAEAAVNDVVHAPRRERENRLRRWVDDCFPERPLHSMAADEDGGGD